MKKLIITLLLAAVTAVSFASCGSSSGSTAVEVTEPEATDANGVGYSSQSDKSFAVTQADKKATSIVIPETIDGQPVTKLSKSVFKMSKAESITLPETITSISEYAFAFCRNLKTVNIPEGVTKIGQNSFAACESLTKIELPSTLKLIDVFAFDASGLETVTIPKTVKTIKSFAFAECSNLKKVIFEGESTQIEEKAFNNSENVVIVAPKDSEALAFAKDNNINNKKK